MLGCFMLFIAFLSAIFTALFRPVQRYEMPERDDVYGVVSWTWNWAGRRGTCRDNPHTITFSPDRGTMVLSYARAIDDDERREFAYELRGTTRSGVRGRIPGETRLTDNGEPVVWDLVLTSSDSHRWHTTDWLDGVFTPEVVRCTVPRMGGSWLLPATGATLAIAPDTTSIRPARDGTSAARLRSRYAAPRATPVRRDVPVPPGVH